MINFLISKERVIPDQPVTWVHLMEHVNTITVIDPGTRNLAILKYVLPDRYFRDPDLFSIDYLNNNNMEEEDMKFGKIELWAWIDLLGEERGTVRAPDLIKLLFDLIEKYPMLFDSDLIGVEQQMQTNPCNAVIETFFRTHFHGKCLVIDQKKLKKSIASWMPVGYGSKKRETVISGKNLLRACEHQLFNKIVCDRTNFQDKIIRDTEALNAKIEKGETLKRKKRVVRTLKTRCDDVFDVLMMALFLIYSLSGGKLDLVKARRKAFSRVL